MRCIRRIRQRMTGFDIGIVRRIQFCMLVLMYCIKVDIPENLCEIDDELKAIYHSKDTLIDLAYTV